MAFEGELGVLGEELRDDFLVLLRFQTACAVDENAAGFQTRSAAFEDLQLVGAEPDDLVGPDAPTELHPPAQHAGVRAGRVDEDAVERFACGDFGVGIGPHGGDAAEAEAHEVLLHRFQPARRAVLGDDLAPVLHALRDVGGLATGCGAGVEDAFAGLGIEFGDGEQRARVLHVEAALEEALQLAQRRMAGEFVDEVLFNPWERFRERLDTFLRPRGFKIGGGGVDRVATGERGGGGIVPGQQRGGFLRAPAGEPTLDQPRGLRPPERGLFVAETGQLRADDFTVAKACAEDGVDESRLRDEAHGLGEVDRLVHGGVVRHAVEPEDLVEPEAEKLLQGSLLRPVLRAA